MQNFLKRLLGRKQQASSFKELQINQVEQTSVLDSSGPLVIESAPVESRKVEVDTTTETENESSNLKNYEYPELQLLNEDLSHVFEKLNTINLHLPIIWSNNSTGIQVRDLSELQSILIAGTPGSGKSNLLHQFIITLLYKKHPSQLKFVLLDYKGLDLSVYQNIEKYFLAKLPGQEKAVITEASLVLPTLNAICIEIDNRYELMRKANVRDIVSYNKKFSLRQLNPVEGHKYLTSIILIIDNVEGFITRQEKEIPMALQRLVTMGYKAGIFIIATTSDLNYKSLPTELLRLIGERVAFRLNSKDDYRKFFDTSNITASYDTGDFHYLYQGKALTGSSVYIQPESIQAIVDFICNQSTCSEVFLLPEHINDRTSFEEAVDQTEIATLLKTAALLIVQSQSGSTSLLQRKMKLGYNKATRIMNQLELAGIVGPEQGSIPRNVYIKTENELQLHLYALGIT